MIPNDAEKFLHSLDQHTIMTAIQELCAKLDKPICMGGILAVAIVNTATNESCFASRSIGNPMERFGGRSVNAAEKISRLHTRRKAGFRDVASSQSANPTHRIVRLRTHGGAVVFEDFHDHHLEIYIAFSGAPSEVDEVICYVIGERARLKRLAYRNPLLRKARLALAA